MAVAIPKTKPWYSPPRVAHFFREARRLPLVSIFLVMFLLVGPAALADVWSSYRGFDAEIGVLEDLLFLLSGLRLKLRR